MSRKITSSQIAKLAGVSRSTVSRVVNGYKNVPKETHDRVMRVIRENDYHPQLSGQLLVGKKSGTLGFFWITGKQASIAEDELASLYLVHTVEAATRQGYLMLTCIVNNLTDPENIEWVNKVFMQGRIDAGIFIGVDNDEPLIEDLISSDHIVGLYDHYHPGRTEPNRISVNYEEDTGGKIIDYLYELGHRKVALLYGDETRYSSAKRKESFLAAIKRHGMEIRPEWMALGGIDEQQGYLAAKDLLAKAKAANGGAGELPTVICANNDAVAFGVYRALSEAGISVPHEMSVTGVDGHLRALDPGLTTYAFDHSVLFSSLVTRTIAAVEKVEGNKPTEFIKGRLVKRGSVIPNSQIIKSKFADRRRQ